MNFQNLNISQIIGQIQQLAMLIVGLVLALLLCGTAFRMAGHAIPYLPAVAETPLAYLCGGYYLYRKAG